MVHSAATLPLQLGAYVVGLAVVHDMIIAPLALATAVLIARTVPVIARSLVLGALVISLTVVAYAYPFARRYEADPGNPSLYPRNVAAGLLLVLAVVWGWPPRSSWPAWFVGGSDRSRRPPVTIS